MEVQDKNLARTAVLQEIAKKKIEDDDNGHEAYQQHITELGERQKKLEQKSKLHSELERKQTNENHKLASSGKGNITNGKIRFINNKDYDDAVENLSKVVERIGVHQERYQHELEQKSSRAK